MVSSYLDTTKIPDDLKKEALSLSCAIQPIIEEENAEEIKGMLNSVPVLNQVTPEERPYPLISLSVCYSQRKIKIIGHHKDQVKGCIEIFVAVWQTDI